MVHQHIVADIVFVLRLILEIGAGIFFHHAVLKIDLQILVIQTVQIYLSDMQLSVRSLKHRRCKHLAHRNIHVRHTVLKCGLPFGIPKLPDVDIQVGLIGSFSGDVHAVRLIEHVDHLLLHVAVEHVIQRIDLHRLRENILKAGADRRKRVGNDRKTALLPLDVLVRDLSALAHLIHTELLLFFTVTECLFFCLRRKRFFSEHLNHRRTRHAVRMYFFFLKCVFPRLESALHVRLVKIVRAILPVIVVILLVG